MAALLGHLSAGANGAPTVSADDRRTVTHVLNRIAFGARPGDVARVQAIGLSAYIDQQLHPDRLDNSALEARLAGFETLDMSTQELAEKYFLPALMMRRDQALRAQRAAAETNRSGAQGETMTPAPAAPPALPPEARMLQAGQQNVVNELMQARMLRAALSERQLEEVLSDFWFNHFNVFIGKGQVRQYLTEYERDVIRPRVLGNFRDLVGAVAHSPAMLFYLDNWQSATPNPPPAGRPGQFRRPNDPRMRPGTQGAVVQQRPTRGLNENYARELMELHTLGVDGGYTQQDVIELAKILTGWTIDRPQQGGRFVFRPQMHDAGVKTFLGVRFQPDGENEGERALDLLSRHPSTARHISYKLAQRFVADDPPPALVARTAKVFTDTKGDLRAVVRSIVTSPEFLAADTVRSKVKTPLEFVVSAVRATGASVSTSQPLVVALRNLGMPLYGCQPPTGYSMTADAWVNTGSLLNRMNFAVQLVSGGRVVPDERAARGLPPAGQVGQPQDQAPLNGRGRGLAAGRRADLQRGPLSIDLLSLAPDTTEPSRDRVIEALLAGEVSDVTRQTLARAGSPQQLLALALGSPEFQRR